MFSRYLSIVRRLALLSSGMSDTAGGRNISADEDEPDCAVLVLPLGASTGRCSVAIVGLDDLKRLNPERTNHIHR